MKITLNLAQGGLLLAGCFRGAAVFAVPAQGENGPLCEQGQLRYSGNSYAADS